MSHSLKKKLSIRQALAQIFFITFFFSGTIGTLFYKYRLLCLDQKNDPQFAIKALIQTHQEAQLPTAYLAELLDLSLDNPQNIYRFSKQKALEQLQKSPLIKEAFVEKIKPQTVHITYTARKPIAYLADFENTVMDNACVPFPQKPFFSPKSLPQIYYLNKEEIDPWGTPIDRKELNLAIKVLEVFQKLPLNFAYKPPSVNTSAAFAKSLGAQEIILMFEKISLLEEKSSPCYIRLSTRNWEEQIKLLPKLLSSSSLEEELLTIDLRISKLAFLTATSSSLK
jgi:hypothetical protein